ncbi:MAG: methyltransferase domain-containing protein [Mycobacteriales bacterium]
MTDPVVSPDLYDETYYTAVCGGHEEWTASGGQQGAPIYSVTLQRAGFEPGMVLVDVGTGRGEMLAVAAELGASRAVGVEYAPAGALLAATTVTTRGVGDRAHVLQADARALPLPDRCADMVTMLDVIEHLSPTELCAALAEVHRVLKPGGLLVGHTFPTSTIYDVTYRALRRIWPGASRSWPSDPRVEYEHLMHVNEQTVRGLRTSVTRAGFAEAKVELGKWVYTDFVPSQRARGVYRALARWRPTRPLAVANIWVHARRH